KLRNSADTTTKSVKNPCYTVIGGTNSALLWDGLSKADIAGGKLFRNLWVNAEAKPAADIGEKVRRALSADVVEFPQGLVKQLGDLATIWPAVEGQDPQPLQVVYESGRNSEQSLALILESKADYWAERYTLNGQPLAASVYRRMAEFYPRIAAIIAVLRNNRAPVITDDDLQWSFNFVETTMRHWVQNNAQLQQDVNGIDDLAMQAIKLHARVIGLWRNDRQQFEQEYSTLVKGKQLSTACMERGGFNWGAMSRLMPISRTTVRELGYRSKDEALAKLQSHLMTHQLAVIEAVKAPGGGKPSPYIFLTDNAVELLYNTPN
ncbi:hypothetical protein, partial [Scandinavium manionii]|uniref:hypothetical protein n=1 Tax=Scandinavium manionii TaxID=2926520 RepID=UPI002166BE12